MILYTQSEISAGSLRTKQINLGTNKSLEVLNYSSYFLCVATTQAGATDQNDPTCFMVVEPWQGRRFPAPTDTALTQLYVGVDASFSQNVLAFGLLAIPNVYAMLYPNVVQPAQWSLIGQGIAAAGGTNLPVDATGSSVSLSANAILQSIQDAVQTNALVKLGSITIPVADLANTESVSKTLTGGASGYYETLVVVGTSSDGYTYTPSATPYNNKTALTAPSLTTQDGPDGEFYAEGTTSSRQSFGNVEVSLQADVTSPSTIFTDAMTSGTNWSTQAGSVSYGSSGATLGATPTTLVETTQTGLVPQNLTLQAAFAVENTQVTASGNIEGTSTSTPATTQTNYYFGGSFSPSADITLTSFGILAYATISGYTTTLGLWDNNGNLLASETVSLSTVSSLISISCNVNLTSGATYWIGSYNNNANYFKWGFSSASSGTDGITIRWGSGMYYWASSPTTAAMWVATSSLLYVAYEYTSGSHSTISVEYQNASDTYYEVQWDAGNLNLIKDDAGTQSTLASTTVGSSEQATDVTLKLVVASNGNITGTLTGDTTTNVSATDTTITSGSMAVTGDSGVAVSNALITGNYVLSDTVTVDVYAT